MAKDSYDPDIKTSEDYVQARIKQWRSWREDLKRYWPQITQNQEMYEFYKSEYSETSSDVSFNMAFSMIESMVAKANDSTLNVNVSAQGTNGLDEFEEYTAGVLKESIEDPDVAKYKGTFRKNKEVWTRDLLSKGNAVGEMGYFYKTGIYNDEKVVWADNPYFENRPLFKLVFNPVGPMDQSYRYYMEKHVNFQSLKDQEEKEVEEKDEAGQTMKRTEGLYKNLETLRSELQKEGKVVDDESEKNIIGDAKVSRKQEPIHLLEVWDGPKLCVIALTTKDGGVIIREVYDPLKIGTHPFLLGMRYKIEGRPYAYGEIDAIYKTVRAQDTVLNQSIESVNRYLRPSILTKDPQANLDSLLTLLEYGGIDYGDPASTGPIQANPPPAQAFQLHELMEQGIERAARYSPYSSGVPNQATDKTAGTASGINSLQQAAEPNFKMILDDVRDSLMRPYGIACFKMIGNLMGSTEVRYALLKGKNAGWVKATKGLMTGKMTIQDMVTMGIIMEEELQDPAFLSEMFSEFNITDPAMLLEETIMFDVDWIVDVDLDDQTEADLMQKLDQEAQLIQLGVQTGVPINPEKAWKYLAQKRGMEDYEEILFSPEELQQQQEQAQMEMQAQQEQQMQMEQMKIQGQLKQGQQASEAQLKQAAMNNQAKIAQEAMKAQLQAAEPVML